MISFLRRVEALMGCEVCPALRYQYSWMMNCLQILTLMWNQRHKLVSAES